MAFCKVQPFLLVMWLEKRLFPSLLQDIDKTFQVVTYRLRGDRLVGHILKSLSHLYYIINLAHTNNMFGIANINKSEHKRTTIRELWKLRTILKANPGDNTNVKSSKTMNLIVKSTSIKQSNNVSTLSKNKKLYDVFFFTSSKAVSPINMLVHWTMEDVLWPAE